MARATGMVCQEQSLVFGTYENGSLKLMTRCLWDHDIQSLGDIGGNDDIDFIQDPLGAKIYKTGRYFVKQHSSGVRVADDSVTDLGEQLGLMIAQGDRDVLGSKGANKHKKNGKFFWLDIGHAYRGPNPLVGSLRDDFTFNQPKEVFKNFSALTDNSLADKMKGIHLLKKLVTGENPSQKVMDYYAEHDPSFQVKLDGSTTSDEVFDSYVTKFMELRKNHLQGSREYEEYDILLQEIEAARGYANDANDRMLKIFEKRLELNPIQLDVLEAFEKLTSKTSLRSNDNTIVLNYARVIERVEWQMELKDGKCVLNSTGDPIQLKERIKRFINDNGKKEQDFGIIFNEDDGFTVEFSQDKLFLMKTIFNEQKMQQYKHGHDFELRQEIKLSHDTPARLNAQEGFRREGPQRLRVKSRPLRKPKDDQPSKPTAMRKINRKKI